MALDQRSCPRGLSPYRRRTSPPFDVRYPRSREGGRSSPSYDAPDEPDGHRPRSRVCIADDTTVELQGAQCVSNCTVTRSTDDRRREKVFHDENGMRITEDDSSLDDAVRAYLRERESAPFTDEELNGTALHCSTLCALIVLALTLTSSPNGKLLGPHAQMVSMNAQCA